MASCNELTNRNGMKAWGLQVLFWKKRAEEELQRSGIDYTIVRPGEITAMNHPAT